MSSIVNIKDTLDFDPRNNLNDAYIGRSFLYQGRYFPGSKWSNPFHVGRDGTRKDCIRKYHEYLISSGLIHAIEELRGKRLGCWCKPLPCHGDLLIYLLEGGNE